MALKVFVLNFSPGFSLSDLIMRLQQAYRVSLLIPEPFLSEYR